MKKEVNMDGWQVKFWSTTAHAFEPSFERANLLRIQSAFRLDVDIFIEALAGTLRWPWVAIYENER